MDKIEVNIDGIPYIHYLPQKTLKNNEHKEEMEIPIMKYALENVKKWKFKFPILKYVTGKSGYNVKIRKLLEYWKIDRDVKINQQNYAKTQPVQKMHKFKKREEEQSEEPFLIIIWISDQINEMPLYLPFLENRQ